MSRKKKGSFICKIQVHVPFGSCNQTTDLIFVDRGKLKISMGPAWFVAMKDAEERGDQPAELSM